MGHRSECLLLMLGTLLLSVLMPGTHASGQRFERLPPTHFVAQRDRLPATTRETASDGPRLEMGRAIRFAGGLVELRVPQDWWVDEVPFGREVRLVISPQRPESFRKMPIDGMWMTYHAAIGSTPRNEATLLRELSARMPSVAGSHGSYSRPTPFEIGSWPAAVAEFASADSPNAHPAVTGRHIFVSTDRGVLEFHASAPAGIVESRSKIWSATWDSLRLHPPETLVEPNLHEPGLRNGILGDWKSYRSRMRFTPEGRVVIIPDALGDSQSSRPLTGTYEMRDDLVFVRWDDGSRLNFRWRRQGNDLFLTDHEGQISRLKRVFD